MNKKTIIIAIILVLGFITYKSLFPPRVEILLVDKVKKIFIFSFGGEKIEFSASDLFTDVTTGKKIGGLQGSKNMFGWSFEVVANSANSFKINTIKNNIIKSTKIVNL